MTVELYGIRNCDTMKKAWTWLDDHGIDYVFHDYKREGVDETWLTRLVERLGWEAVLNRAGTTFGSCQRLTGRISTRRRPWR